MRLLILYFLLLTCSSICSSQDINTSILNEIQIKAKASHSDALIIIKDGKTLVENYYDQKEIPIYIASAGKSLVNLAIGKLLEKNLLDSLDQRVHTLFPEWKQGMKKDITIRMLLNHTSGIQNYQNASIELEPAPDYQVQDVIDLALAAELTDTPGNTFSYNNKAVALLGGIVEKASGLRFDDFFIEHFYKPMDIADYNWVKDKSGNPTTHGAFYIKPSDLIKFGQLVLHKGVYNEKRIISESWVAKSLDQGQAFDPRFGLLWWRKPAFEKRIIDNSVWESWKEARVNKTFMRQLKPLKNQLFQSKESFYEALSTILGDEWSRAFSKEIPTSVQSSKRIFSDRIVAYYADGFRGNYLVIVPEKNIVAVRCAGPEGFNYETDFFREFVELIIQL